MKLRDRPMEKRILDRISAIGIRCCVAFESSRQRLAFASSHAQRRYADTLLYGGRGRFLQCTYVRQVRT